MNFFLTAILLLIVPLGLFLAWDQWRLGRKASEDAKLVRPYPAEPLKNDATKGGVADGSSGDGSCSNGGSCS